LELDPPLGVGRWALEQGHPPSEDLAEFPGGRWALGVGAGSPPQVGLGRLEGRTSAPVAAISPSIHGPSTRRRTWERGDHSMVI
jgi:hypothetical protein